ncbi:MAG: hypothetical protein COB98_00325 [Flavobacteriaceae bacterium]|nr:MAG: hypothetical protein COB98_00325 [Flavobacteriaceae bacterium]
MLFEVSLKKKRSLIRYRKRSFLVVYPNTFIAIITPLKLMVLLEYSGVVYVLILNPLYSLYSDPQIYKISTLHHYLMIISTKLQAITPCLLQTQQKQPRLL